MRAVTHVEGEPFRQREVAEDRVFYEQIVPAGWKQLALQGQEPRHAVAQLPLDRGHIGVRRGLRYGWSFTARPNPPEIDIDEVSDALAHAARPASHRQLRASLLEDAAAAIDGNGEVVNDLRRRPFARRAAVPIGGGPPHQGSEHELGNRREIVGRHRITAFASSCASAATGDVSRTRATVRPALSAIVRSASASAAESVRTERAHW